MTVITVNQLQWWPFLCLIWCPRTVFLISLTLDIRRFPKYFASQSGVVRRRACSKSFLGVHFCIINCNCLVDSMLSAAQCDCLSMGYCALQRTNDSVNSRWKKRTEPLLLSAFAIDWFNALCYRCLCPINEVKYQHIYKIRRGPLTCWRALTSTKLLLVKVGISGSCSYFLWKKRKRGMLQERKLCKMLQQQLM